MNFLKPPQSSLLNFVRYRRARNQFQKLTVPEDKSNVILGKWKPSIVFPKPGVSDKAVSELMFLYTVHIVDLCLICMRFNMLCEVISPGSPEIT